MTTHSSVDWQQVIEKSEFSRKIVEPQKAEVDANLTDRPRSPIGNYLMNPWLTVPIDWRRPKDGQTHQLYWCNSSQYGMLYPRPSAEAVTASYDVDDYYTHDSTFSEDAPARNQDKPKFFDWCLRRIGWQIDNSIEIRGDWFEQHFPDPTKRGRVLDLGCGSGKILLRFHQKGFTETIGIEPDPTARAVAASHGLTVLDGTAEALPSELLGQQFDVILMTHVLEHTVDPVQATKNATSLLAPGGKLIIETPNNLAIGLEEAGITWRWLDVPRHLNFFTPQSLKTMCVMADANLSPSVTEFRGFYRQFTADWVADEQRIWDKYHAAGKQSKSLPARNRSLRSWRLLWRTLFAPDERRYDSVRVIATKQL